MMPSNALDIKLHFRWDIVLILLTELLFFLLFLKSNFLGLLFLIFIGTLFLIYLYPEIGFAVAFTGNTILYFLFDHISVPFTYPEMLTYIILLVLGATFYLLKHPSIELKLGPLFKITLAIAIILIFGLFYSSDRTYGIYKITFFFILNIPYFVVASLYRKDFNGIEKILFFTIIVGLILSYFSFQIASDSAFFKFVRFRLSEDVGPLNLSRALAIAAVSCLYFITKSKKWMPILFGAIALPFLLAPLNWTGSRAPMLGIILSAILYYILQPSQSLPRKIIFICIGLVGIVYYFLHVGGHVASRMSTPVVEEASAAFRLLAWFQSILDFIQSPLLGIGTGSFFLETGFIPLIYPHNLILELACENGILGLSAILLFIAISGYYAINNIKYYYKQENRSKTQLSIVVACLFANTLWNAMFTGNIFANNMVWFSAGLVWAIYATHRITKQTQGDNI